MLGQLAKLATTSQETAYQSLLRSKRQQYHGQTVRILEQRFPDIVETRPELLAYYCTEAGLPAQAVSYWQQAGHLAVGRSANVEAIRHFSKGLELLEALPATPERVQQELTLQLGLGAPLLLIKGSAAPEVAHAYARAHELCQEVGNSPQRFLALIGLGRFISLALDCSRPESWQNNALPWLSICKTPSLAKRPISHWGQP